MNKKISGSKKHSGAKKKTRSAKAGRGVNGAKKASTHATGSASTKVPINPLAWLTAVEEPSVENQFDAQQTEDKFVMNTGSTTTLGKSKMDAEPNEGFGFFDSETIRESSATKSESEDGFGFFDDDAENNQAVNDKTAPVAAEDDGFGFFSPEPETIDPIHENASAVVVNLSEELTVKNVEQWCIELGEIVQRQGQIVINVADLDKIDSCGIQLLCAVKMAIQKQNGELFWRGESNCLRASAVSLGVDKVLGVSGA